MEQQEFAALVSVYRVLDLGPGKDPQEETQVFRALVSGYRVLDQGPGKDPQEETQVFGAYVSVYRVFDLSQVTSIRLTFMAKISDSLYKTLDV